MASDLHVRIEIDREKRRRSYRRGRRYLPVEPIAALIHQRIMHGLSQKDVAELVGYGLDDVQRIELFDPSTTLHDVNLYALAVRALVIPRTVST